MFIWFVLRDDRVNPWQSGLLTQNGTKKPAFATFGGVAHDLDARNAVVSVPAGTAAPAVRISALPFAYFSAFGAPIGVDYKVVGDSGAMVDAESPEVPLDIDGWVTVHLGFTPESGHRYFVNVTAWDPHGNQLQRTLELVAA